MIKKAELKQKLKVMIVQSLNLEEIAPEDIQDDDVLFGDKFGLDSIDAVELVFQIKEHFGVEIKNMNEGRPALQSVSTLAAFLEKRMNP
ncbi:MAG: phosphopantetheine-binding protein [Desulfococcaceae bacterium]|jgi:acyl carrier protein|nr:phosphopantetheine-binding protein [Desulfococcaceae bacterium]